MNALRPLQSWIAAEPIAALWLGIVAVLLFGAAFTRLTKQAGLSWPRSFFLALRQAFTVVAVVWACYFLLDNAFHAFNQLYGSFTYGGTITNRAWQEWRNMYGGGYHQTDLQVAQYAAVTREEVLPPSRPEGLPLYRNVTVQEPVEQNSITGFRGDLVLTSNADHSNAGTFNVFALSAEYQYDILNSSDRQTRAEFRFPISFGTKLYEDIVVIADGEPVDWRVVEQSIFWEAQLAPGQQQTVTIRFHTWGENSFLFEVPQPREITSFDLKLAVNTASFFLNTYPDNGGIQVQVDSLQGMKVIDWRIDRSILAPRLGIDLVLKWPYAPYQDMIATLPLGARASTFFLTMAVITLLLCSVEVRPAQLALLALLFMLPFLILMSGGIPHPASLPVQRFAAWQARMLPVLTLLPLLLALFVLRRIPRLPLLLILTLMALFAGAYPLTALLLDIQKRKALETILQLGMIAYVFLLTLFTRLSRDRPGQGVPIDAP